MNKNKRPNNNLQSVLQSV